jgi:hypothetical protein
MVSKIFVDRYKTLTAADITSADYCQQLINRQRATINRLQTKIEGRASAPSPSERNALRYARCAISDLNERLIQLKP